MSLQVKTFGISTVIVLLAAIGAASQTMNSSARNTPLSKKMREKLVEMQIKEQKKDFNKLVARSEKLAKITEEIHSSFEENKRLTESDQKKLTEAEHLLKKIRKGLRAGKDKKANRELPATMLAALQDLQEKSSKLYKEVKKTTRHSVSVVAIQTSNVVLKLVRFLKFGKD